MMMFVEEKMGPCLTPESRGRQMSPYWEGGLSKTSAFSMCLFPPPQFKAFHRCVPAWMPVFVEPERSQTPVVPCELLETGTEKIQEQEDVVDLPGV